MTYGQFLLLFLVVPIAAALVRDRQWRARSFVLLLPIVYLATTPWDDAAVRAGLWSFDPSRICGVHVLHLPLEEVLFFGLQTVLSGLLVQRRLRRAGVIT
jgi:lycopene cyclase domain-containing protein